MSDQDIKSLEANIEPKDSPSKEHNSPADSGKESLDWSLKDLMKFLGMPYSKEILESNQYLNDSKEGRDPTTVGSPNVDLEQKKTSLHTKSQREDFPGKELKFHVKACLRSFRTLQLTSQKRLSEEFGSVGVDKSEGEQTSHSESLPIVNSFKLNFQVLVKLLKQIQYFTITKDVLINMKVRNKNEVFIKFLWQIIQPHFFTEKKVIDIGKINSQDDEIELEDNNNFYLIEQFLKTAMALNCFNEGYYFLSNQFKDKDYLFIRDALYSFIKDMQDDLEDYDAEDPEEEKSEKSSGSQAKEALDKYPQKFDKIKTQTHWLIFMKLFDLKKRETYGLKCLQKGMCLMREYIKDRKNEIFLLDTYFMSYTILHKFLIEGEQIIKQESNLETVLQDLTKIRQEIMIKQEEELELEVTKENIQKIAMKNMITTINQKIDIIFQSKYQIDVDHRSMMIYFSNSFEVSDIDEDDANENRLQKNELQEYRLNQLFERDKPSNMKPEDQSKFDQQLQMMLINKTDEYIGQQLFQQLKEYTSNPLREEFLQQGYYNLFNQYNIKELVLHMQKHLKFLNLCKDDKEQAINIYGGKHEMTRAIHHLTIQYLRGMRAYHLRNKLLEQQIEDDILPESRKIIEDKMNDAKQDGILTVQDICSCLKEFLDFLVEQKNERIEALIELRNGFKMLTDHLKYKGENDEKLVKSELYQQSVILLKDVYKEFKNKVNEAEDLYKSSILANFENQQKVQQFYTNLMQDEKHKRAFSLAIFAVHKLNIVTFYNEPDFKSSIKSGFQQLFNLEFKKQKAALLIDFYGLTGAGFQYKDSMVKIMIRHKKMSSMIKHDLFPKIKEGKIKRGDPINILNEGTENSPWRFVEFRFKTRKARDGSKYQVQYMYILREFEARKLEKKEGDKKDIYEDIAFKDQTQKQSVLVKIKFENELRQHQVQLAQLIKKYSEIDARLIQQGTFLLTFLRIKGLIPNKNLLLGKDTDMEKIRDKIDKKGSFIGSLGWLLMLISYFQKKILLPNLQDKKITSQGDLSEYKVKEKIPGHLKGLKKKENLRFENQLKGSQNFVEKGEDLGEIIDVDYFFLRIYDAKLQQEQDLKVKYFRKFKQNQIDIIANFLKFMAKKVASSQTIFNVKKKRLQRGRQLKNMFISIKDPFIKYLNHGSNLVDKSNYRKIIQELTNLLEAASQGNVIDYMYSEFEQLDKEGESLRI